MKKLIPLLLVLSFLLLLFLFFISYERSRVAVVVDGDSLSLADGRRVRLLGLDAPETGRCFAIEAKERLQTLALGKHARLKNVVHDSYGRLLANVIVEEPREWFLYLLWFFRKKLGLPAGVKPKVYLNEVMVEEGLARFESVSSPYYQLLKEAGWSAKSARLGVYSSGCLQKSPPDFSCVIKGNIRDQKKTYHLLSCPNYGQVEVDTSFGDAWFCSEKEARSAGFVKASGCIPK